jgi:hypothetical protein
MIHACKDRIYHGATSIHNFVLLPFKVVVECLRMIMSKKRSSLKRNVMLKTASWPLQILNGIYRDSWVS